MIMKKLVLICAVLFLLATPSLAEVKVTTSTKYYGVTGTTKNQILRSIKKNSPHWHNGKPAAALTNTDLKFNYSWRKKNGRCAIEKVVVHLHLTYTYPKLANTPTQSTKAWWIKEMARYIDHEKTHGRISKKWAKIIDKELAKLQSVECVTAKRTFKDKTTYLSRKLKDEQSKFDRITNHGRNGKRYRVRD